MDKKIDISNLPETLEKYKEMLNKEEENICNQYKLLALPLNDKSNMFLIHPNDIKYIDK